MGDRANVVVKDGDGEIFLYTHWGAEALPSVVSTVIGRKQRWGDVAYLTRIIFCEMVRGSVSEETGYGISLSQPDNDGYPYIVIDSDERQVIFQDAETRQPIVPAISFETVASDGLEWPKG